MSGKLNTDADRTIVKEALSYIKGSGHQEEMVVDFLNELIHVLHSIFDDQEVDIAKHYAGISPSQRREQLNGVVRKLEEAARGLEVFGAPMLRYKKDRTVPPTRPLGLSEYRSAMANTLTMALSVDYIKSFGVDPMQWDPNNVSMGPINTFNRAFAIEETAERIVVDLLNMLANGIRETEKQIAKNTPAGGPRETKVRNILLLNLVALWVRINDGKLPLNYSGGETKFFNFCSTLSRAIGAGTLCTATHLAIAVKTYNAKFSEKPSL